MEKKGLIYLIVFVILGVIAGVIIYYSWLAFKEEPILEETFLEIPAKKQVILSLVSDKSQYSINDDVVIDIYLDSQENLVDGLDVVMRYDSQYLQVKDKTIFLDTTGSVFSGFPSPKIDETVDQIKISAITSPGGNFQGQGKVASLNFKAKKQGETIVSFVFEKGSTIDSNVSSYTYSGDILSQVENITLKISLAP